MVLLEFAMSPLAVGESAGAYVARLIDIVDKSGLPYQLNPMGTVMEGELHEVLAVVTKCHDLLSAECGRITTTMRIDYRAGSDSRIRSKVESVERRLGRKLSTT
jgi:uncharacterized protein (TIGR00106 family)